MKKFLSIITLGLALAAGLTSCMDKWDEVDTSDYSIFYPSTDGTFSAADSMVSITELKFKYCASSSRATYARNTSNWEHRILTTGTGRDIVTEGIVVSNDGPWGALYQQLILRQPGTGADGACIVLAIKNTCLYPYFPIGQKVRVKLSGLYIGAYSKTPKIGYPYFTSKDNHSLGPIPFEMCATNIIAIGQPNPNCEECQYLDFTTVEGCDLLRDRDYMKYEHCPYMGIVRGKFVGANDKDILAPNDPTIYDDGYGVDRYMAMTNGGYITVRTSTQNEISNIVMPKGKEVELRGVMTYYDGWQIQIRDTTDFVILNN